MPSANVLKQMQRDVLRPPRTACLLALERIGQVHLTAAERLTYSQCVENLERSLQAVGNPAHARPLPRPWKGAGLDSSGFTGAMKDSRRNTTTENRFTHFARAKTLPFPSLTERGVRPLPEDTDLAIDFILRSGKGLAAWRNAQASQLRQIAATLQPMNKRILHAARRPESCKHVAVETHVVLLAALSDSCRSPDTTLAARMLMGHQMTGEIEDSGLFRPLPRIEHFDSICARVTATDARCGAGDVCGNRLRVRAVCGCGHERLFRLRLQPLF